MTGRLGIGVEREVEQRPLGKLREVHVVTKALAGVGVGRRMTPGGDVLSWSGQEEAKLHHA